MSDRLRNTRRRGIGKTGRRRSLVIYKYNWHILNHVMNEQPRVMNVVTGLTPGPGGVPMLLSYFESMGVKVLYPQRSQLKVKRWKDLVLFCARSFFRRREPLCIVHHDAIPPFLFWLLIIFARDLSYFVIDNSFFCIKSYNHRPLGASPCMQCLEFGVAESKKHGCQSFPVRRSSVVSRMSINILKRYSHKIKFLCLSDSNSDLIRKFYGETVNVKTVGFTTAELEEIRIANRVPSPRVSQNQLSYDFVFHGSDADAKGVDYVLSVAANLPEFSFLFPFQNDGKRNATENCTFQAMSWLSGLEHNVLHARLVFCPSLWTYTPEAAMLKTMLQRVPMAYFKHQHTFSTEFSEVAGFVLSGDPLTDAIKLRSYVAVPNENHQDAGFDFAFKFLKQSRARLREVFLI